MILGEISLVKYSDALNNIVSIKYFEISLFMSLLMISKFQNDNNLNIRTDFITTFVILSEGSRKRFIVCIVGLVVIATGTAIADIYLPNLFPFLNLTGFSGTYSSTGNVELSGPFFQSLGTNGRSCATCHQPSDAFGLSAANAQLRYLISGGRDPLS